MPDGRPAVRFLILWHVLVAGLLFAVADLRVLGTAFWNNRYEEFLASACLIGAYLAVALVSVIAAARGKPLRLSALIAISLSLFGLVFLALLLLAPLPP